VPPSAAQQLQRQKQQAAGAGGADGGAPAGGSGVARGLAAVAMPQLDVHATLQRLLEGAGGPAKKRKFKLLPFIAGGASDVAQRITDD